MPINSTDLFLVSRAGTNYQATGADLSTFVGGGFSTQASATQPTTRPDGSALQAGDLWYDSTNQVLKAYDGAAFDQEATGNVDVQAAAAAPTVRSNGQALVEGDLYFNSTSNSLSAWDGAAWISTASNPNVTASIQSAATAPTTRPDGSALAAGDQWYDTTNQTLNVYDGTAFDQEATGKLDSQSAAAAPTTRSNGQALANGDLYYNTTDDSLYVYDADTTTWVRHVKTTGDVMTGKLAITPVALAGSWDLTLGNHFTIGAAAFPTPTNMVAGQSGVVFLSAAPTSWPAPGGVLKYYGAAAPAPTTFPAIVPYYSDGTNVYLGPTSENIN